MTFLAESRDDGSQPARESSFAASPEAIPGLDGAICRRETTSEDLARIKALLAKRVAERSLDRVAARAVIHIFEGKLDPKDLKQLLPPRRIRAADPAAARDDHPGQQQPLRPGDVLGGVAIRSVVKSAASATIYAGYHAALKIPVAVKAAGPGRASQLLHREAEALASITHPHVIRLWDAGAISDHIYIILEWLPRSLADFSGRRLSTPRALRFLGHVTRGLRALLRAGFTHGDVKPSNVLISPRGVAKIADLGLARGIDGNSHTATDEVMATWRYAAPERFTGVSDHRSDIYSLALTAYQLMTGFCPIAERADRECLAEHLRFRPEPLHWTIPDLPRPVSNLLCRMAARDPESRPQNYEEILTILTCAPKLD